MDCGVCQAPGMCICAPPSAVMNYRPPQFMPFGGIAFAALATAALVGGPRFSSPPRSPKKRNPKRVKQKAQRIARKKTRRSV